MNAWQKVGICCVDSGQLLIVDPCYLPLKDDAIYDEYCKEHNKFVNEIVISKPFGIGVITSTGYGDGGYEVFIKKEKNRVKEIKIVFFE